MIRRDYIMKLIQQMLDSLFLLLNEKSLDDEMKQERLKKFYQDYVGEDKSFYLDNSIESILEFLKEKYGEELLHRVEMLSEIMFQDGMLERAEESKVNVLDKALALIDYLDENSTTYSLVRKGKKDAIEDVLSKLTE